MRKLRAIWRAMFDVREGELARTVAMALYLLFVMFAYYILKPVSRALFLTEFKVDRLPYLNMLIAVGGGLLAYGYGKFAVRASLRKAVGWSMGIAAGCLAAFWWLVTLDLPWMLYAFNVWVSLFSAVLVSQGWLVAANVFDARSAKRLYGLLGLGCVLGAAFGGAFTAFTARLVGSRNLLLASMAMVGLAYVAFRVAAARAGPSLAKAHGTGDSRDAFTFREITLAVSRSRHLQLIVGIMMLTFITGALIDFQFQAAAAAKYKGDQLAAFFGRFHGIYLNAITLPLQFFLTAAVVRRLGLGGTLQVMPASIAAASAAILGAPGLGSAMAAEMAESASRYTINRTGMELLYLPLPAVLRNRTKAFVDVFVDRMSRGLGGVLLAALLAAGIRSPREIAAVTLVLCGVWMALSVLAHREYIGTVRRRLARRRLGLESSRVNVDDPATLKLLEESAEGGNARQARYAVSMLAEASGYDARPLLRRLSASPVAEVRGAVYEAAWFLGFGDLFNAALDEVRSAAPGKTNAALGPAVDYVLWFAPDKAALAKALIEHPNAQAAERAVAALRLNPGVARQALTKEWIAAAARDQSPERRRLAALAAGIRGDRESRVLPGLLRDSESRVVSAAFSAAATLGDQDHVHAIVERLGDPRLRRAAIQSLASFGPAIAGTLADILADETVPAALRRQIPRVLRLVPHQRSVDVLIQAIDHRDVSIRAAVLKALNRLRDRAPELEYGGVFVANQILAEARHYFELHAALWPIAGDLGARTATGLLARTLEHRCEQTIERLFRLLGLRYPQREIHAAYLSLRGNRREEMAAALEFLEHVLERSLRRVVLPLLDSPGRVIESGQELFGVEAGSAESAVGELIRSGDPWLSACAIAAAAEQGFEHLAGEIAEAGGRGGRDVAEVARAAMATLAR